MNNNFFIKFQKIKMKKEVLILILIFLISNIGNTQNEFFERMSGLKQNNNSFFNVGAYEISVIEFKLDSFKQIFSEVEKVIKDSIIIKDTIIVNRRGEIINYKEILKNGLILYKNIFIINKDSSLSNIFYFKSFNVRNKLFEHEFIREFLNEHIPKRVYNDIKCDSFNFVGLKRKLDNNQKWIKPNFIEIVDFSLNPLINWALFESEDKAKQYLNDKILNKRKKQNKFKELNVIFEDISVKAIRTIRKIKIIKNQYTYFVCYFLQTKLRGKYVYFSTCFSAFDEKESLTIPKPIQKIMTLKNMPN